MHLELRILTSFDMLNSGRSLDGSTETRESQTEGVIHKSKETHAPPSNGCAASSSSPSSLHGGSILSINMRLPPFGLE